MSHDWTNRHWIIRTWPQPPEVWAVVIETEDMCRKSLDGTLVVLKWEGATPEILELDPQYTRAGILAIMATPAWSEPDPPEEPDP